MAKLQYVIKKFKTKATFRLNLWQCNLTMRRKKSMKNIENAL